MKETYSDIRNVLEGVARGLELADCVAAAMSDTDSSRRLENMEPQSAIAALARVLGADAEAEELVELAVANAAVNEATSRRITRDVMSANEAPPRSAYEAVCKAIATAVTSAYCVHMMFDRGEEVDEIADGAPSEMYRLAAALVADRDLDAMWWNLTRPLFT